MTVFGTDRRRAIIDHARESGRLEVSDLAERVGAAIETVRRDLIKLEKDGLIRRSHGYVYPVDHVGFESTLDSRLRQFISERQRIADVAFKMIGEAETIYIDEGSTCLLIAQRVQRSRRAITVVTPSLPAATTMAERGLATVIMLGGAVGHHTFGTTGPRATEMILSVAIDVAILSANGISSNRGLTTPNPAVADVKATVVNHADRKIFVGNHTKFGLESFARFAAVKDFDVLVTDRGLAKHDAQRYAQLGPTIHRV